MFRDIKAQFLIQFKKNISGWLLQLTVNNHVKFLFKSNKFNFITSCVRMSPIKMQSPH